MTKGTQFAPKVNYAHAPGAVRAQGCGFPIGGAKIVNIVNIVSILDSRVGIRQKRSLP